MIKILLVDDHAILRQGLENILRTIPDFQIIGSVDSGEEAVNFCKEHKVEVVLMDVMMGGMTGLETTKWIKEKNDDIKVIIVSSELSEELIHQAMANKANGYITKFEDKSTIIEAIRSVMDNKPYFSKKVTDIILQSYFKSEKPVKKKSTLLTAREEEVLIRIAKGLSNKEIAEELFISIKTVETHKGNILSKLNLKNTAEMVLYAVKNGLITP